MASRVPMLCEWSMLPRSGRGSVVGTKLSFCISVFIATDCIDVGQYSHLALENRSQGWGHRLVLEHLPSTARPGVQSSVPN